MDGLAARQTETRILDTGSRHMGGKKLEHKQTIWQRGGRNGWLKYWLGK